MDIPSRFLVGVFLLGVAGCGQRGSSSGAAPFGGATSDTPTEADALAFIQSWRAGAAHARAVSVEKLDGVLGEEAGVERYKMQVRVHYVCEAWPRNEEYVMQLSEAPELNCVNAEGGEEHQAEGWIYFEKRESGWKADFQ